MSQPECQASPELRKFFEGLLELKEFVKKQAKKSHLAILDEIHTKLDNLIKEAK